MLELVLHGGQRGEQFLDWRGCQSAHERRRLFRTCANTIQQSFCLAEMYVQPFLFLHVLRN